jgi:hypothetical protein
MIPPIFEAYARILHQIRPQNEEQQTMRWVARAAELGRELGAETGWWEVIGTAPFGSQPGERLPEIGTLTGDEVGRLVSVLDRSQGRDACWFGLWSGWGFLSPGGHSPSISILGDPLLLISGTVSDVLRFTFHGTYQSPTVWWPDDRSWFVHTNFDAMSTFVGGRCAAIQHLVGSRSSRPSRSGWTTEPSCNESDPPDRLHGAHAGTLDGTADVDPRE